jgi:tetratricopeptide (TPR) repeat protein
VPAEGWTSRLSLALRAGWLCALALLSGATGALGREGGSGLRTAAAQRVIPPDVVPVAISDPRALTPEIRQWVIERVPRLGTPVERLERLIAVLSTHQPELRYDPLFTAGATEVLATGRFNCVGYAHLIVALSREIGLETYYVEVRRSDRYRREGDLVLHAGHLAAAWGPAHDRRTVELEVARGIDYASGVRASDERAVALHYTNLGGEALIRGDVPAALSILATAIDVDPTAAGAWVNLGVALRRGGDNARAEAAYRQAIAVEPRAVAAYDNLYSLLQRVGRPDAADELLEIVTRRAGANPWLLLSVGDSCLRAGDLEGARRFYRRAHSLARSEAAPSAALAAWALAVGDAKEAERWLKRAETLDPEEPRLVALRARLSRDGGAAPVAAPPASQAAAASDG